MPQMVMRMTGTLAVIYVGNLPLLADEYLRPNPLGETLARTSQDNDIADLEFIRHCYHAFVAGLFLRQLKPLL